MRSLVILLEHADNVWIREIISRILSIQQSSWPYKNKIIKRVLMEEYPQASIRKAFRLLKKS